jgi:glycosyltransferase involved in cell wall biosynthesis
VLGQTFKDRLLAMGCSNRCRFWIETTVADSSYLGRFAISDRLKDSAPLRILFISRIVPSKGPGIAIAAFDLAQRQLPGIPMELVIAGDGPALDDLKAFVQTGRIEHVIFTGAVHGNNKMDVILRSQILLFPTMHDEGLPNVVLEAMLYGMPVLARFTGSIADVIEDGVNGFLTQRTDPEIFAEWLVKLAREPSSRHAMAIANHHKALRHYASTEVRQRLLRILDDTLNEI